ncbi:MAG: FG-GAP-like repeat-containing protein, partial [Armatimonadota bacterium]|nr:FG-GAP-like repeat-containing protein [Armatimonadota bacterium]
LEGSIRKLEEQYFYLQPRAYPNDKVDWSSYAQAVEERDALPAAVLAQPALSSMGAGTAGPGSSFSYPMPGVLPGANPQPFPGYLAGSTPQPMPGVSAAAGIQPVLGDQTGLTPMQFSRVQSAPTHEPSRLQTMSTLPPAMLSGNPTWQFVGPTNDRPPFAHQFGIGPVSGRVNAIAYDPAPGHAAWIYVGAAAGGLWRSEDNGATWTPLSDSWPFLQVSSIAVDPTGNTIYVGGGDFDDTAVGYANGLMMSTDAGNTWRNVHPEIFTNVAISKILLDPDNPQIVMVATGRGFRGWGDIWRGVPDSSGSLSFTDVLQVNPANGFRCVWCDIVATAPDGSNNGYRRYCVVGYDQAGNRLACCSSPAPSQTRGTASSWLSPWNFGPPPVNGDPSSLIDVAASPTIPDRVYAMVGSQQLIVASADGGQHFNSGNIIASTGGNFPSFTNDNHRTWDQSGYDLYLRASTNGGQDVLYAGLFDILQNPVASPGGRNVWNSIGFVYDGHNYPNTLDKIHTDQHSMVFNLTNPNEAMLGNDGGLYFMSYSPSTGASAFSSLNANLGTTEFHNLSCHPTDPNRLIGGAQDNGSPRCTGDLNSWNIVTDSDGGPCAIDPVNPAVQYTTTQWLGSRTVPGTKDGILRTTDGWQSYISIKPPIPMNYANVALTAPMVLDPNNHNLLYTATNYLWRCDTSTNPPQWTSNVGGQLLSAYPNGYVTALAVAPTDSNRIYTGSSAGELWMSTNAGAARSWTLISSGAYRLPNLFITSISVSPTSPNSLLVGLSGTGIPHLWQCTDTSAGTNSVWTDVSGTSGTNALPNIPLNAIARNFAGAAGYSWFVGTDIGVFYTNDGGSNWSNATQPLGLPNVQVNDLQSVPGTGYLNAATYGRGIWRIDLSQYRVPSDFDRDGLGDLVAVNVNANQAGIWYMNGTTISSAAYVLAGGSPFTMPAGWSIVGVGDFNGDGHPDLVVENLTSGNAGVWFMNGATIIGSSYVLSGGAPFIMPAGWSIVAVGDFNADGQPDLVVENLTSGNAGVWFMTG